MPTFYNFRENGVDYPFDDVFVPVNYFQDGNLWIFGWQLNGGMGDNGTGSGATSTPITTFGGGNNWKSVPGPGSDTDTQGALKSDGTMWFWGFDSNGEIPDNSALGSHRLTPVTSFAGGNDWISMSVGSNGSAVKSDGTLWTWGQNGRFAVNSPVGLAVPVTVFGGATNWRVSSQSMAIKTDGTLWVWGGQLGNNTTITVSTPITTFTGGNDWNSVSSGAGMRAAIKTDGTLWVWGTAVYGKLGTNNSTSDTLTPVTTFAGGTNWKQVSCGGYYAAAIKTDGTLWLWGNSGAPNNRPVLGGPISSLTPITTFSGGTNWKQVSCGEYHTTAIKTDGTLWVWGWGGLGQLGDGNTVNVSSPITTFLGGNDWKVVRAGRNHTCAIKYIGWNLD